MSFSPDINKRLIARVRCRVQLCKISIRFRLSKARCLVPARIAHSVVSQASNVLSKVLRFCVPNIFVCWSTVEIPSPDHWLAGIQTSQVDFEGLIPLLFVVHILFLAVVPLAPQDQKKRRRQNTLSFSPELGVYVATRWYFSNSLFVGIVTLAIRPDYLTSLQCYAPSLGCFTI